MIDVMFQHKLFLFILFEELHKKNCQQSENSSKVTFLPKRVMTQFLEDKSQLLDPACCKCIRNVKPIIICIMRIISSHLSRPVSLGLEGCVSVSSASVWYSNSSVDLASF